ncbi:MAG: hypothetical protein K0S86_1427 [Geminicoccaceae bacterium]|jgi:hypothetical protein|nr:hypothetical protein [Geminicoccaceae bacterium]
MSDILPGEGRLLPPGAMNERERLPADATHPGQFPIDHGPGARARES